MAHASEMVLHTGRKWFMTELGPTSRCQTGTRRVKLSNSKVRQFRVIGKRVCGTITHKPFLGNGEQMMQGCGSRAIQKQMWEPERGM